jgi:hypothetical protein
MKIGKNISSTLPIWLPWLRADSLYSSYFLGAFMKKRSIDYQEHLLKKLKNEEFATAYLNEARKDEDSRVLLLALKNIARAQAQVKKS